MSMSLSQFKEILKEVRFFGSMLTVDIEDQSISDLSTHDMASRTEIRLPRRISN